MTVESLHTLNIESRPVASEPIVKPPCKGLCKDCKRAANTASEPLQAPSQTAAFAANRD